MCNIVDDVSYFKCLVFWFDKKDMSEMLQRGIARPVVGPWGQSVKWR